MNRTERARRQRFDAIMRRHAGLEKRTLADLHAAGYRFSSVQQAWAHYQKLATLRHRFTEREIEIAEAVYAARKENHG